MPQFIFTNEQFLKALHNQYKAANSVREGLYKKLGVKPLRQDKVTILVISENHFDGYDTTFDLIEHCEKVYKIKVDMQRTRIVVVRNIQEAKCSPHTERASFIFIPGENILDAHAYSELKTILPSLKR